LLVKDEESIQQACEFFKYKVVFKKRTGGYDGKGTFILKSKKNKDKIFSEIQKNDFHVIAEALIPFHQELAGIFVRGIDGTILDLPLVETHQKNSKCDWVRGPVKHPAWKKLKTQITSWLKKKNYVGAIAFELFDTGKELLINESAPRVHNSGHYSQQALSCDQFTLHVQAVTGMPLPRELRLHAPAFVMANLLGLSENPGEFPRKLEGQLHWYGKKENLPGRKMGHLNLIGQNSEALLKLALKERKRIKL